MATLLLLRRRRQRQIRAERVLKVRATPLETHIDKKLISRYRFPRDVLQEIVARASIHLGKINNRSHAINEDLQVQVFVYVRSNIFR